MMDILLQMTPPRDGPVKGQRISELQHHGSHLTYSKLDKLAKASLIFLYIPFNLTLFYSKL
jgi:hypothetical protein